MALFEITDPLPEPVQVPKVFDNTLFHVEPSQFAMLSSGQPVMALAEASSQ